MGLALRILVATSVERLPLTLVTYQQPSAKAGGMGGGKSDAALP